MNASKQHSPTPWCWTQDGNIYITNTTSGLDRIAVIETENSAFTHGANAQANAAHIVRAVNAHDPMREALRELLDIAAEPREESLCHSGISTMDQCSYCQRVIKARAALKLADE